MTCLTCSNFTVHNCRSGGYCEATGKKVYVPDEVARADVDCKLYIQYKYAFKK